MNFFKINKKNQKQEQEQEDITSEDIIKSLEGKSPENAAKMVIEYVMQNPELAEEVLREILNNKEISNKVFEKAATEISVNEHIPDHVIPTAVKDSDINVPDEIISNILENGSVNRAESIQLIHHIDDEQLKQQSVEQELSKLYISCSEFIRDDELLSKLQELNIVEKTKAIEMLERKIIAKRMALNFNKFGTTKISVFASYLPPEDMIQYDLSELVISEHDLLPNKDRNVYKEEVKELILKVIAQNVVDNYNEIGEILIPSSVNHSTLTKKEQERFIEMINLRLNQPLNQTEIDDIKFQMKGNLNTIQLKEFVEKVRTLPKDKMNDFIKYSAYILEDRKMFDIYKEMISSGMLQTLEQIPEDKMKKCIAIMKETSEKKYLSQKDTNIEKER